VWQGSELGRTIVQSSLVIPVLLDDRRAPDAVENHALQRQYQTSSPLRQQHLPEIWMGSAEVLHREIQAKWPTRAVLADRFWAIRRIPSNYQRHSVWGIENRLHWVLDVVFHDDLARLRTGSGPQNMAIVKHMAMNLVRNPKDKHSLKVRRKKANLNPDYLEPLIRQTHALT
jgi:hypothetical protein